MDQNSAHFIQEKLTSLDTFYQLARVFIEPEMRTQHDAMMLLQHEFRLLLSAQNEPQVLMARLDYWQREWRSTAEGNASHPLSRALQSCELPDIASMVQALCRLAFEPAQETSHEFSAVLTDMAHFFASIEQAIEQTHGRANDVAPTQNWYRIVLSGLIHDLPAMSRHQRTPLPLDLIARYQLNAYDLESKPEGVVHAWSDLRDILEHDAHDAAYSRVYEGMLDERFRKLSARCPEMLYQSNSIPGAIARLRIAWRLARRIRKARIQS